MPIAATEATAPPAPIEVDATPTVIPSGSDASTEAFIRAARSERRFGDPAQPEAPAENAVSPALGASGSAPEAAAPALPPEAPEPLPDAKQQAAFIAAQKAADRAKQAERKARQAEARASDAARKHDELSGVLNQGKWKEDPMGVLDRLGLDRSEFLEAIAAQYVRGQGNAPSTQPDATHQRRSDVEPWINTVREMDAERQAWRAEQTRQTEIRQEVSFVQEKLSPKVTAEPERWEFLMKECDGDAHRTAAEPDNENETDEYLILWLTI